MHIEKKLPNEVLRFQLSPQHQHDKNWARKKAKKNTSCNN